MMHYFADRVEISFDCSACGDRHEIRFEDLDITTHTWDEGDGYMFSETSVEATCPETKKTVCFL